MIDPETADMPPIKVAFLGDAHIHVGDYAAACLDASGVEIVGVVEAGEGPYAFPAAVPRVAAPSELAAHDLAVITSDIASHARLARAVTAPHVFIEKPLGLSEADASCVAGAVRETGAVFHTGLFLRRSPLVARLADALQAGAIGRLRSVQLSYVHAGLAAGWLRDWPVHLDRDRMGYGVFGDLAAHLVDLAIRLGGPCDVEAALIEGEADAQGFALLRCGGVPTTIHTGALAHETRLRLRFAGEEGALEIAGDTLTHETASGPVVLAQGPAATPRAGFEAVLAEIAGIDGLPGASLDDALAVNACLDAMHREPFHR